MKKTTLFADFDGTIVMEDTVNGIIRLFTSDDAFNLYHGKLVSGEMTLSQVVRYALDGAPSSLLPRMLEYVKGVEMRPGFSKLLDVCEDKGIDVVVISGGMRQFVDMKMEPYRHRLAGIYATQLDASGETIRLYSDFDDGNELVKKTAVMELYPSDYTIAIGDSYTDKNMALAVDIIFARDILAQYLEKLGRAYIPFEDFFSVAKVVADLE